MNLQTRCSYAIALSLVLAIPVTACAHSGQQRSRVLPNPIKLENALPGDTGWENDRPGFAYSEDAGGEIAGYTDATSVNVGETITFRVSVKPVQKYDVEIFRLGWYGGKGGRRLLSTRTLQGDTQPDCLQEPQTGLLECTNWHDSFRLHVPRSWPSGIYVAMLTNHQNFFRRVMFVVRNDNRRADILYQQPVTTYQAYNCWPCGTPAGKSFYISQSSTVPIGFLNYDSREDPRPNLTRAVKVSFDRPQRDQYGNGLGDNYAWEIYLVQWLEREGYDVSYSTSLDTHARPWLIQNVRAFLSVGHDEYWSKEMFDQVEAARDRGVNLGFMGANNIYWQVRMESSRTGTPNRVMVAYKNTEIDPITNPALKTIRWRATGRPEQTLIGIQYTGSLANNPNDTPFPPFVVENSTSWPYNNTGLFTGNRVNGIIGYEVDRLFTNSDEFGYPQPPSLSYLRLGQSPFADADDEGALDLAESSLYTAPSGAQVFATGTMSWSWALAHPDYANGGIQQMTRNILDKFIASPVAQRYRDYD